MDKINVTGNSDGAIRAIEETKAALRTLEGKTVTLNFTRAQYEALTGRAWDSSETSEERTRHIRAALNPNLIPDPSRRMSFKASMENIRRRFSNAIRRLGEL